MALESLGLSFFSPRFFIAFFVLLCLACLDLGFFNRVDEERVRLDACSLLVLGWRRLPEKAEYSRVEHQVLYRPLAARAGEVAAPLIHGQ